MDYTVKVFHADHCQPCRLTMKVLDEKGMLYDTSNISHDESAREYLLSKGMRQTPVVEIYDLNGDIMDTWSGLNMSKIHQYFK